MPGVAAVIDLGRGNVYYEGTCSLQRPVLVVLNLGGGNLFKATSPGVQGSAILGVSMLVNLEGGNRYDALDVAQGSALAGVGMLVEFGGNNKYHGVRRVQGEALGGVGLLISRGGHNDYHAAMWAQGMGGPLGFGLLEDLRGGDHYYCGGLYPNSYKPETPGYEGFGQGVGAGIRQSADGGIGVLLNGGGHNVYEFDYLSHGGGYWCGMGFARDFGGNSQRLIARKAFYGERTHASSSSSDSAAAGAAITPWASASTTAATAPTKAPSWAAAWPGIARSACSAASAARTITRPPAD